MSDYTEATNYMLLAVDFDDAWMKNRALRRGAEEITTLRQQLAKSEARVAELESQIWAVGADHCRAFILRKQAEKLEEVARLVKEGSEAGLSTVASIYEGLLLNVTSLRDEADEADAAERAGGEK